MGRVRSKLVVLGAVAWACGAAVDPSDGGMDRLLGPKRDPLPAGVDAVYEDFLAACRQRDASALWTAFGPGLRDQVDAQAQELAMTLEPHMLAARYGYRGPAGGFDGTALLHGLMRAGPDANPCPGADLWRRIDADRDGEDYIVVAQRPDGRTQALKIAALRGSWRVINLSTPR